MTLFVAALLVLAQAAPAPSVEYRLEPLPKDIRELETRLTGAD